MPLRRLTKRRHWPGWKKISKRCHSYVTVQSKIVLILPVWLEKKRDLNQTPLGLLAKRLVVITQAEKKHQKEIQKFSTLSACLGNKQSTIVWYATLQWGFSSRKGLLLLIAKCTKRSAFSWTLIWIFKKARNIL